LKKRGEEGDWKAELVSKYRDENVQANLTRVPPKESLDFVGKNILIDEILRSLQYDFLSYSLFLFYFIHF
jgi:hypothetical protein